MFTSVAPPQSSLILQVRLEMDCPKVISALVRIKMVISFINITNLQSRGLLLVNGKCCLAESSAINNKAANDCGVSITLWR